jgi:hypothetical protein
MYNCGCTLMEGARHCNVHHSSGPRCPWCAGGLWRFLGSIGVIYLLSCTTVAATMWRFRMGYGAGLAIGLIASSVWGGIVGLLVALTARYPIWFGLRLPG